MVWYVLVFFIGVILGAFFMALAAAAGKKVPSRNHTQE